MGKNVQERSVHLDGVVRVDGRASGFPPQRPPLRNLGMSLRVLRFVVGILLIPLVVGTSRRRGEGDAAIPSTSPITTNFTFSPPSDVKTCQQTTFTWLYAAHPMEDVSLTVTITNSPLTPDKARNLTDAIPLISRVLGNGLSAIAQRVVWSRVDVPPGEYQAVAFTTEYFSSPINVRSPTFQVIEDDVRCLVPSIPPGGASASSPTPTAGGSVSGGVEAHRMSLSPGAIAGIVVGATVGVTMVVLAVAFRWYSQRSRSQRLGGPYTKF
ncbi:hypothetical protein BXZ70DRAFT_927398 [Cristinia sonorae]|uniref:Uncharacterized protein n=1 Tax=Cristinia sonorae TaxID=1940300 RepID=A0A8K0XRT3_9AGAR|nr:hypothetical protein BXZ70DRAFT_927398 [Cristinia sonorae]